MDQQQRGGGERIQRGDVVVQADEGHERAQQRPPAHGARATRPSRVVPGRAGPAGHAGEEEQRQAGEGLGEGIEPRAVVPVEALDVAGPEEQLHEREAEEGGAGRAGAEAEAAAERAHDEEERPEPHEQQRRGVQRIGAQAEDGGAQRHHHDAGDGALPVVPGAQRIGQRVLEHVGQGVRLHPRAARDGGEDEVVRRGQGVGRAHEQRREQQRPAQQRHGPGGAARSAGHAHPLLSLLSGNFWVQYSASAADLQPELTGRGRALTPSRRA